MKPTDTSSPVAGASGSSSSAGAPVRTAKHKALTFGKKGNLEIAFLWYYVLAPLGALAAAIPLAIYGGWFGWHDAVIMTVFYLITGLGVTVGFHRYLTHGSFKAPNWLRWVLTMAGTMAVEGSPIRWVADHRRHHMFSDEEFDPHSPWRFGRSVKGLTKGMIWAHTGWLFDRDITNARRFCPDLLRDPIVRGIHKRTPQVILFSTLAPAVIGGLWGMSWHGALTGFFWGGLVRIGLVHHVTWAVNSVCHVVGERPFETSEADLATNFWPLAILSFGESWHNLHHADPTCARHGVDRGQLDSSARLIWVFEKLGWATEVRWPNYERLATKRVAA